MKKLIHNARKLYNPEIISAKEVTKKEELYLRMPEQKNSFGYCEKKNKA